MLKKWQGDRFDTKFGQDAFFQDTKSLQRTFSHLSDMMGKLSELVEAYKPGTERETGVVFRNTMDAFRSEFDTFLNLRSCYSRLSE